MPTPLVTFSARQVGRWLVVATSALVLLSLGATFSASVERVSGVRVPLLFLLNQEQNVPTWFASMLHAFAAVLLAFVGVQARATAMPYARIWFALAALFAELSLDEFAGLHERAEYLISAATGVRSSVVWAVGGALLVLIVGIAVARFLLALPRRSAISFLLAGGVFASGALAVDTLGVMVAERAGRGTSYMLLGALEEALELLGMVLFIRAIIVHAANGPALSLAFTHHGAAHAVEPSRADPIRPLPDRVVPRRGPILADGAAAPSPWATTDVEPERPTDRPIGSKG